MFPGSVTYDKRLQSSFPRLLYLFLTFCLTADHWIRKKEFELTTATVQLNSTEMVCVSGCVR